MDVELLARLIAYAALIAATIEYCEIVKRRLLVRRLRAEQLDSQTMGLQGLVRVFLADER